jgi:hypothetical protein
VRRTSSSSQISARTRTSQTKSGDRACNPPIPFEHVTTPV